MNTFPIEILNEILFHLHQQDKVQCLLVSRQWNDAICRVSVFQTVRLTTSNALTKFAAIVQQDQTKGEQVQQLILDFNLDENAEVNALFSLLPNVRVLILNHAWGNCFITDGISLPWHNSMRCIGELSDYSIVHTLLSSNIYSKLTKLWCLDSDGDLIAALTNAPALQNLDISPGGVILLSTLETIHQNAPNLRSLRISTLRLDGSDLDYEVISAPLMTTFETEQAEQTDITAEYDMLNYIDKKYPNITRLDYCNSSEGEVEELDELFNTCWIPLLRKRGPQLKKLYTFCNKRLVDFFKNNTNVVCPINELCFGGISSQDLNQLTNVEFLHSLEVNQRLPWEFEWLSKLTVLKQLEMGFSTSRDEDVPSLNDILANCPSSLQTLLLKGDAFSFNALNTHIVHVTHLSFINTTLPRGIDGFISQCFPQLTRLIISLCTVEGNKLTLPNTNLSYFELEEEFPEENNEVEVVTRANNKQRRYKPSCSLKRYRRFDTLNILNASMGARVRLQPEHEVRTLPYFTLICNSLHDISLLDTN
ncbi:hypothetical protein K501DRAFT_334700 [Backusella circina FSU 941]|nr:hypothetical protein K501DRAFT_334700 [Backusella circina FSU 941]